MTEDQKNSQKNNTDAGDIGRRDFVFYTYPADRHWVEAVRRGETVVPGFAAALRAHSLVEAAYRSAATGSAVEIGDDFS